MIHDDDDSIEITNKQSDRHESRSRKWQMDYSRLEWMKVGWTDQPDGHMITFVLSNLTDRHVFNWFTDFV